MPCSDWWPVYNKLARMLPRIPGGGISPQIRTKIRREISHLGMTLAKASFQSRLEKWSTIRRFRALVRAFNQYASLGEEKRLRELWRNLNWLRFRTLNRLLASYASLSIDVKTGKALEPRKEEALLEKIHAALDPWVRRRVARTFSTRADDGRAIRQKSEEETVNDFHAILLNYLRRKRASRHTLVITASLFLQRVIDSAIRLNRPRLLPPMGGQEVGHAVVNQERVPNLSEKQYDDLMDLTRKAISRRVIQLSMSTDSEGAALQNLLRISVLMFLPSYVKEVEFREDFGIGPRPNDVWKAEWASFLAIGLHRVLRESQLPRPPLEQITAVCKKKGVFGAKMDELSNFSPLLCDDRARRTLLANPARGLRVLASVWRLCVGNGKTADFEPIDGFCVTMLGDKAARPGFVGYGEADCRPGIRLQLSARRRR